MSKRPEGTSPITANIPTPLHTALRHVVTDYKGRGEQVTGEMIVQLGIEVVLQVVKKYPGAPFTEIESISMRHRFKLLEQINQLRQAFDEVDADTKLRSRMKNPTAG